MGTAVMVDTVALTAAVTHTARLSVAPDGDRPAVVAKEVLPGPARDGWAVDRVRMYSDGSPAVNHTALEWASQDWRLRLPYPDSTARPIAAVDALPGDIVTLEAPK